MMGHYFPFVHQAFVFNSAYASVMQSKHFSQNQPALGRKSANPFQQLLSPVYDLSWEFCTEIIVTTLVVAQQPSQIGGMKCCLFNLLTTKPSFIH